MRLEKLWIKNFKNLNDFNIDFDLDQTTNVLIGHNGMGKSNLIEALVVIFRDIDLGNSPSFTYDIVYHCKRNKIFIKADPERKDHTSITINGKMVSFTKFKKENAKDRKYLPNYLFAYYSGNSTRLESYFDTHQKIFYKELLDNKEKPLRPLFYARLVHSQFVLLSYFLYGDPESKDFLKQCFNIHGLESVLFILKKPPWKSTEGDERFWYSKGVVKGFLNELYKYSLAPIYNVETINPEYNKTKREEHLYLFIPNEEKLKQITKKYEANKDFFKVLESTYISELIYEVRIKVRKESPDCKLIFKELSEGEQQLLTVLGLLKFTQDEESLFLLDEPDTHLNPVWKLEYLNLLERIVGKNNTSHILISTHDPIVIGGLVREQVIIFEDENRNNKITTRYPEIDPKGMGVAALLTSELFGLSTTLDLKTQQKLDRKRELYLKSLEADLTPEELIEKRELADELGSLDFTRTIRDPLYDKFVKAMLSRDEFKKPVLSPDEVKKQQKIAQEIMDEILEEEKE